jgi:hypothetical protein
MAKSINGRFGNDHAGIVDLDWLQRVPLQWSIVLAVRAALRLLPGCRPEEAQGFLDIFRAIAIARFSAKYPNSTLHEKFILSSRQAGADPPQDPASEASFASARAAAEVAQARTTGTAAGSAYLAAATAINSALAAASILEIDLDFRAALDHDVDQMRGGGDASWTKVVDAPLWPIAPPVDIVNAWENWSKTLRLDGDFWEVWIDWYDARLHGQTSTELRDAAFTDLMFDLDWLYPRDNCTEIIRRLAAMEPDPSPLEGITSPITISRRPDGRIGVEPGPFSLPTLPASLSPTEHRDALSACRNRATQLTKIASSPHFQGRREYAQILTEYAEWLPGESGTGNVLLADGEARILNKLFTAEEAILPPVFASKLSVLLEDHIGLRSYYPEIERHYQAVNSGRLVEPLSRDAVDAIHSVIRSQTPTVFDETISPAIDEAAKPVPEFGSPNLEDLPPLDQNRPKPPQDPIVDADPLKSRSYILASAFNRIWSLLQKGKDTSQAIEGWQKTYLLMKPHIGQIIEFLKPFLKGADGTGGPTLPPTIGV